MIELTGEYNKDCKVFIDNLGTEAIELIQTILDDEISQGIQVRIMPDTHIGKGIVIGFTMPVTKMVNPNYIGVDIGCSVTTYKLNKPIEADYLPVLDNTIRDCVPMGRNIRNENNFDTRWIKQYFEEVNKNIALFQQKWAQRFGKEMPLVRIDNEYIAGICKKIGIKEDVFYYSIGTLGGGNHFIEVGKSSNDDYNYLTVHSGSRNFGKKVCDFHATKMLSQKGLPQEYHDDFKRIVNDTKPASDIPQKLEDLANRYEVGKKEYMLKGNDMYAYLLDMIIAQTYAQFNHKEILRVILENIGAEYAIIDSVYSMHNFIDTTDWIIRKGAIRSYAGERMVIPLNMRDGILICEGKSNPDWNYSAPHGAGRIMARNKALEILDMEEFKNEMKGIYSTSIDKSTIDESPMAYKDKNIIIDAIKDTATIIDSIKPIMSIKHSANSQVKLS